MAIFEIRPDWTYAACFHVGGRSPTDSRFVDWLALIFKKAGEHNWTLTYRFRYSDNSDPFADDEKNAYTANCDGRRSAEDVINSVRVVADVIALRYGQLVDFHRCTSSEDLMDWMMKQPWCHVKKADEPS